MIRLSINFIVRIRLLLFSISFLFAETQTVAISYFDNTSGLEEYNPLSKGLADMLITDLSNVKSIQIVEREKLESLLKEIELGEGKFMDESTVQKLGKGLGADIILTGAFLSIEPDMRIDARLIDVETGKIIKANKVLGKSSDFFILVSQLSTQLINNLNLTYENEFTSKVKTIDIDDVVEYSQAINLLDNGYELEAQKKLMKIVQNNPEFGLAYKKLDNLSGRIKLIQIEKEKIREEKINDRISKIDIKDDYFACEVVALASEIRSWDESMLFMKNIKDLGVDSSKECAISIKEEFMYIEFMYYSLYKKYDQLIDITARFVKLYPDSEHLYTIQSLSDMHKSKIQKIENGYNNYQSALRCAEIGYHWAQIRTYLDDDFLMQENYVQLRNIYKKWILNLSLEDLILLQKNNVPSVSTFSHWDGNNGMESYFGLIETYLELAEKFQDNIILNETATLLINNYNNYENIWEDTIFEIEDDIDDGLYKIERNIEYIQDYRKRKNGSNIFQSIEEFHIMLDGISNQLEIDNAIFLFYNIFFNTLDSLYNKNTYRHSLLPFDSLVYIEGLKILDSNFESKISEGPHLDPYFIKHTNLWGITNNQSAIDNIYYYTRSKIWKELMKYYSWDISGYQYWESLLLLLESDFKLKESDSKKYKKLVRHERKKYKDKLKEKDLFIVEINNSASKKSLLCLYAEVYGEHYMYSNEISTRLELLNNYVLPETGMWTLEEQLIEIYEANYELGNYYEAELVLNQALLKVPHTVFGERVLYLKEELLEDGFIK